MKIETLAIHAGYAPDPTTKAVAVPIYQTTSYAFDNTQHGADLFDLKVPGNIYTRIMNPTNDVLEQRVAAMEGGVGALAVASGMASITCALFTIAESGDNIVSTSTLYGGTYNLFAHTLPRLGIEVRFADAKDLNAMGALIDGRTKAVFCESLGNPAGDVVDLAAMADMAHAHGVPLIVDNTVPTPYLCQPFEHGADIVVHALTKYMGGKASSILSFGIQGGREAGARFIDALGLITRLVNIGDAKPLACHPATTTHRQLSPQELERAGVSEDLVRLSIGLEHVDDIIADIEQALAA